MPIPPASDPRIDVLVHGYASDWGSWELLEATLEALRLVRNRYDPDLVVLISGSDCPAMPLGNWEAAALQEDAWHGDADVLTYRPRWGADQGKKMIGLSEHLPMVPATVGQLSESDTPMVVACARRRGPFGRSQSSVCAS